MPRVEYIEKDHPAYQPDCIVGDSFCYDKFLINARSFLNIWKRRKMKIGDDREEFPDEETEENFLEYELNR